MECLLCHTELNVHKHHFFHDKNGKGIDEADVLCEQHRIPAAYVWLCEPCHNMYEEQKPDFFFNDFKRREILFILKYTSPELTKVRKMQKNTETIKANTSKVKSRYKLTEQQIKEFEFWFNYCRGKNDSLIRLL